MKFFVALFLMLPLAGASAAKPEAGETCFNRIYPIAEREGIDEGFSARKTEGGTEEQLILIPLNAELHQLLLAASRGKNKVCVQGTLSSGNFFVYAASKK